MNKKVWLPALIAILFAGAAMGEERGREAGLKLIARARELEGWRGAGRVDVQGTITMKLEGKEQTGKYRFRSWGPERWREELSLGGFEQKRDGVKNGYWQLLNVNERPPMIAVLDQAMDLEKTLSVDSSEWIIGLSKHQEKGQGLSCVEVMTHGGATSRELCFDSDGLLAHVHLQDSSGGGPMNIDYGQPVLLVEKRLPSAMRIELGSKTVVEITMTASELATGETAPATEEAGNEFWAVCQNKVQATVIKAPPVKYPEKMREKRVEGTSLYYVRVEVTGKLSHIMAVRGIDPAFEKNAKKTLATWLLNPSTCGGQPVMDEMPVEVTFRLY